MIIVPWRNSSSLSPYYPSFFAFFVPLKSSHTDLWIDHSGDEGINWRASIQITRCYITWECLLCIRQADIQLSHPVVWPNYTKKLPWTSNYHYPECQQTDEHWIVAIRAAFAGTFFPDALKCNPFKAFKSTPFPLSDSQSQNRNYNMQRIVTGCSDILIYSRSGHKTMKSGYLFSLSLEKKMKLKNESLNHLKTFETPILVLLFHKTWRDYSTGGIKF